MKCKECGQALPPLKAGDIVEHRFSRLDLRGIVLADEDSRKHGSLPNGMWVRFVDFRTGKVYSETTTLLRQIHGYIHIDRRTC